MKSRWLVFFGALDSHHCHAPFCPFTGFMHRIGRLFLNIMVVTGNETNRYGGIRQAKDEPGAS